jgi:hypothetical protein
MVIRGGTRGNGKQLSKYLVTKGDNERIAILEVDGRRNASEQYLHQTIQSMDLMSELTKSQKGFYHAQINPAYGEDKNMDWFKAAEMLGVELGMENQRRVIVLHEKKGRTHAHVVWERYDYETGIMKSDSFSRLAQDRARQNMEVEFGHKQTPRRNAHRPALKASLTTLWHQTGTGAQFINACKNNDYMIAQGSSRDQFVVVDENGHSFNLVRQLKDVRLKDVRHRLRNEQLMSQGSAITFMRNQKSDRDKERTGTDKQKAAFKMTAKQVTTSLPHIFDSNAAKITKPEQPKAQQPDKPKPTLSCLKDNSNEITKPQSSEPPREKIKREFKENTHDAAITERERIRHALNKQREENRKDINRDIGMEYD